MANLRWKDLTRKQKAAVYLALKELMPYQEFEISNGRPINKNKGGSAADFTEVSVEGLFDLVAQLKFSRK